MILDLQLQVMSMMIGSGLLIGLNLTLYDRYFIRSERTGWRWVTDGFFWCVQALLVFLMLFHVNGGEWRLYVLLSIICGFAGYEALIKKGFVTVLEFIDRIVKWIVRTILLTLTVLIVTPLIWLWKLVQTTVLFIVSIICRILFFIGRVLLRPFDPIFQYIRKKCTFLAKKIKKWLNLLYNRE